MTAVTSENVRNSTECTDGYQTDVRRRGPAVQMMNSVRKCSNHRRNINSHVRQRQLDYVLHVEYHQAHRQKNPGCRCAERLYTRSIFTAHLILRGRREGKGGRRDGGLIKLRDLQRSAIKIWWLENKVLK